MATFQTSAATCWSPSVAFAFMSDLRNLATWDPNIRSATIVGDGLVGPAAQYDLRIRGPLRPIPLSYRVTTWDCDRRVDFRAETRTICSVDSILVAPLAGGGSRIDYSAEVVLKGALRVLNVFTNAALEKMGRLGELQFLSLCSLSEPPAQAS